MDKREKILQAIYEAVDEMNQTLPPERCLEKSLDTALFGRGARLDSLGLVNLIVETEARIEATFGATVTLADEKAMSQKQSPFRNIGTLADYAATLVP